MRVPRIHQLPHSGDTRKWRRLGSFQVRAQRFRKQKSVVHQVQVEPDLTKANGRRLRPSDAKSPGLADPHVLKSAL